MAKVTTNAPDGIWRQQSSGKSVPSSRTRWQSSSTARSRASCRQLSTRWWVCCACLLAPHQAARLGCIGAAQTLFHRSMSCTTPAYCAAAALGSHLIPTQLALYCATTEAAAQLKERARGGARIPLTLEEEERLEAKDASLDKLLSQIGGAITGTRIEVAPPKVTAISIRLDVSNKRPNFSSTTIVLHLCEGTSSLPSCCTLCLRHACFANPQRPCTS